MPYAQCLASGAHSAPIYTGRDAEFRRKCFRKTGNRQRATGSREKRRTRRLHGLKGLPKNSYPRLCVFIPAKFFENFAEWFRNRDAVSRAKAVQRLHELHGFQKATDSRNSRFAVRDSQFSVIGAPMFWRNRIKGASASYGLTQPTAIRRIPHWPFRGVF